MSRFDASSGNPYCSGGYMKYYIATSLSRHDDHNLVRDTLAGFGHEITYDWTVHGSVRDQNADIIRRVAMAETQGVQVADIVIVLLPGGRGTHVELGMALVLGKPVLLHTTTPETHFNSTSSTCLFYWHQHAIHAPAGPLETAAKFASALFTPVWKIISVAPDYEVSSLGEVRSRSRNAGPWKRPHTIRQWHDKDGYSMVDLHTHGHKIGRRTAALVLRAFVGPPANGQNHSSHRNGSNSDNRLINLRWASASENHADKLAHGTLYAGSKHHGAKLTEDQVRGIRRRISAGASTTNLAVEFGVLPSCISNIKFRRTWAWLS